MASHKNARFLSYPAAADHSSNKSKAGVLNSSGQVALAGAGVAPGVIIAEGIATVGDGTLVQDVAAGGEGELMCGGVTAVGDDLTPDANGKFVTATSGDHIWAVGLAVGADTVIIRAKLGYRGTKA